MKQFIKQIVVSVLTVVIFSSVFSCTDEDNRGPVGGSSSTSVDATLTLRVPVEGLEPSTRALGASDENYIEAVDVLVFRKDAVDGDVFFQRAQTTIVNGTGATKTFSISLKKSNDPLQFVVFANCRSQIDALTLSESQTRNEVLAEVTMTETTAWNSTTGSYDPLPMWGQTDFRSVTDAASAAATIDLIRSLARIDVKVASAAQNTFKLKKVYLYNSSTQLRLAPMDGFWNKTTKKVTAPSQPDGGYSPSSSAYPYTTMTTANVALERTVYAFEAPASTGNTVTSAPCLVVGGSWNDEAESFYRIDFHNGTDFLPLLRNHLYTVEITGVAGRGYGSRAEALAAGFTDLSAVTHVLDEGQVGSVVWDGRHYLGLSHTELDLYPEQQSFNISVVTNYGGSSSASDGGWKAEVNSSDQSWISIAPGTDSGDGDSQSHTLTLNIGQYTSGNPVRTGSVTVTAGRLKQTITVNQQLDKLLSLDVSDVELVFTATSPEAKSLRMEWEPAANPVTLELIHAGSAAAADYPLLTGYIAGLSFSPGTSPEGSASDTDGIPTNGGLNTLSILPQAASLTTFAERRSILKITATNADNSETTVKEVLLRQFDYAISVSGMTPSLGFQQYATYPVTVKCNAQWKVTVTENDEDGDPATNVIDTYSPVVGEPNTSPGETFNITLTGPQSAGQSATVKFESQISGLFTSLTFIIRMAKNEPNCYIVNPVSGSNVVTIPVNKAYEVWSTDNDLKTVSRGGDPNAMTGTLTAGLLWQDAQGLITSVDNPTSQNKNGEIQVTVNTAGIYGNAVVYLAVNNVIRWSWHIWVTDYNPNDPAGQKTNPTNGLIFMDRGLGAINTIPGDIGSYELLYQWGRKDPFPSPRLLQVNNGTSNSKYIYNLAGTRLTEGSGTTGTGVKKMQVPVSVNLANSIINPLTFYFGKTNNLPVEEYDWYTSDYGTTMHRTTLWQNDYKTVYDPCPDGWRIPPIDKFLEGIMSTTFIESEGMNLSIGFISSVGSRHYTSGNFSEVGTLNYIWSGYGGTGGYGYASRVRYSNQIPVLSFRGPQWKSSGYSVRCVKVE